MFLSQGRVWLIHLKAICCIVSQKSFQKILWHSKYQLSQTSTKHTTETVPPLSRMDQLQTRGDLCLINMCIVSLVSVEEQINRKQLFETILKLQNLGVNQLWLWNCGCGTLWQCFPFLSETHTLVEKEIRVSHRDLNSLIFTEEAGKPWYNSHRQIKKCYCSKNTIHWKTSKVQKCHAHVPSDVWAKFMQVCLDVCITTTPLYRAGHWQIFWFTSLRFNLISVQFNIDWGLSGIVDSKFPQGKKITNAVNYTALVIHLPTGNPSNKLTK